MNSIENNSEEDFIANQLLDYLRNGKISTYNYRSTAMPFFYQDKDSNQFENNTLQNFDDIPENLNRNIKVLYKLIGNRKKEFYLGEWIFMSLDEVLEKYECKKKDNQNNIFDIAFRNLGMGHIEVVSCDLISHLLFKRRDGGSNGHDREFNYKNIIENGSKNYNKFYFSNWFYNIV